ncbi:MAG: transcriptional regulator [Thermoplasmata archaeon HGW-Thermoplasmata-1]|nr:MAG: transcriptional regulator [Thermoplasmata archaeon HGW-Thermoplasmata-1]
MDIEVLLEQIRDNLVELNSKMEQLIEQGVTGRRIADFSKSKGSPLDAMALLELPDHLRQSAMSLYELERATAEEVSAKTGRSRSIESAYLNQLVGRGYVKRERGKLSGEAPKKVYFYLGGE